MKRTLFRINGGNPTIIDLGHVTTMVLEGKKISFTFMMNGMSVDLESEEVATNLFEELSKIWVADVLE